MVRVSAVAMFVPVAVMVMNVEEVTSPSTTARVSALMMASAIITAIAAAPAATPGHLRR